MRMSDRSSDVCSSDLLEEEEPVGHRDIAGLIRDAVRAIDDNTALPSGKPVIGLRVAIGERLADAPHDIAPVPVHRCQRMGEPDERHRGVTSGRFLFGMESAGINQSAIADILGERRSEEHTSELPSLMRISYAVFCLKTKIKPHN